MNIAAAVDHVNQCVSDGPLYWQQNAASLVTEEVTKADAVAWPEDGMQGCVCAGAYDQGDGCHAGRREQADWDGGCRGPSSSASCSSRERHHTLAAPRAHRVLAPLSRKKHAVTAASGISLKPVMQPVPA